MDSIRTVKVKLGEDIRRFPFTDDQANLPAIRDRIEGIFAGAIPTPWRLAWTDEDGDVVNIRHPADLHAALLAVTDGTLRLIVLPDTSTPQAAGAAPKQQQQQQQQQQAQSSTPSASASASTSTNPTPNIFQNLASHFEQVFDQIREEHEARERAEQEAAAQPTPEVPHPGVTCDVCQASPIVGTRFKCTTCFNFDICARCEARGLHANHVLLRLRNPDTTSSSRPPFCRGPAAAFAGAFPFAGPCGPRGRPCGPCPRFQQQQQQQQGGCGRASRCERTASASEDTTHAAPPAPSPAAPELDPTRWDREINLLSEMGITVDPDALRRLLDSHQGVIAGVLSEIFRGDAK